MKEEMLGLEQNNTCDLVQLPFRMSLVGCRRVLHIKSEPTWISCF